MRQPASPREHFRRGNATSTLIVAGHGTTIGGAEQAIDDLQRPLPAIAAIAALCERTAAAFQVAGGDIVEHQSAVLQVLLGECGLDGGLALEQPVECGVEFVLIDLAQAEHGAEAGGGGGRRERTGGGKLGAWIEDAPHDHGQHEVAAAVAFRAQDAVEANFTCGAEQSGDVSVRQGADDAEGVLPAGITVPHLSTPRRPSTWAWANRRGCTGFVYGPCPRGGSSRAGEWQGGEFRFGDGSIYMAG